MAGLDKLIDLVVQFLEAFRFVTIVDCYQVGVQLRRGVLHRVLQPGIRFLIPCYIDHTIIDLSVPQPRELCAQSLVTKDDRPVSVSIAIMYQIVDPVKALLEVATVASAVDDACQATLAEHVLAEEYADIRTDSFVKALTTACRMRAEINGIYIHSVRIIELSPSRTFRLIGSK